MPAAPVYTPEFVERGYNNRAAVPDHPRWFAQYAQWSAAAFDRYRPARNVRYGPGPKEVLDVFAPAGKPRGTLVFLHGGYWRALDKDDFAFVAAPFVAAGIAVANVNYDLCPDVSIAAIVDECRRAVQVHLLLGTEADHSVVHRDGGVGLALLGHVRRMLVGTDRLDVADRGDGGRLAGADGSGEDDFVIGVGHGCLGKRRYSLRMTPLLTCSASRTGG